MFSYIWSFPRGYNYLHFTININQMWVNLCHTWIIYGIDIPMPIIVIFGWVKNAMAGMIWNNSIIDDTLLNCFEGANCLKTAQEKTTLPKKRTCGILIPRWCICLCVSCGNSNREAISCKWTHAGEPWKAAMVYQKHFYDHTKTKKHNNNFENTWGHTLIKWFIKTLFFVVLLWFCADVCGRWLVYMKIQTSCNGFYGDVYKGYRTSHNECLCIFSPSKMALPHLARKEMLQI